VDYKIFSNNKNNHILQLKAARVISTALE